MLFRFKRKAATAWFSFNTREIYETAPSVCDPSGAAVFVSQVCHRDLPMYLLAVKSLAQYLRPRTVHVLDDTSLTERDKAILRRHIKPIEISPITKVKNTVCPNGGTWERLLFIADLALTSYVIQVDSDTLTLKCPNLVREHIGESVSFTLGEWPQQQIVFAREAAALVKGELNHRSSHVQMVSEANLDRMPTSDELRYVRGCSGFAGFARNSLSRSKVEKLSQEMATLVGQKKWREWGSEQVTSNLVVANSPKAEVLPFPEYCFHSPDADLESATFIHFIGSYRYHGGRYGRLARRIILQLHQS